LDMSRYKKIHGKILAIQRFRLAAD